MFGVQKPGALEKAVTITLWRFKTTSANVTSIYRLCFFGLWGTAVSSPSRRSAPRWLAVGGCGHWRRLHPGRPASSVLYNLPTHREIQSRLLNCKPAQGGRQLRIHAAKPTQKINREGTQNELDATFYSRRCAGLVVEDGRVAGRVKEVPSADRRLDPVVGRLASR